MRVIAYAKIEGERVLIGTFESLDGIHDEVALKLKALGLQHWITARTFKQKIYIVQGLSEFRLIWGNNKND